MSSTPTRHGFKARGRRTAAAVAGLLGLALVGSACSESTPSPSPKPTPTARNTSLTLGMFGHPEELAAYEAIVGEFNAANPTTSVELEAWPDAAAGADALGKAVLDKSALPDVFLTQNSALKELLVDKRVQPVSTLLDERGVDFGDRFSRSALEAFGADNVLQCMPYGITPQVIFYNTDLINDDVMAERGLSVPTRPDKWSFSQFAQAAQFAARPKRGIRGFAIDPTIEGIAPFLTSGGGKVFDDEKEPTSLAFSDDASRSALNEALPVLRDPKLSLSAEQLAKASGLEWFKRGKVAMIAGTRDLVPELRDVEGLNFDIRAMPTLERPATVGSLTALCMSADAVDRNAAADLIVELVSDEHVARIARLGHLLPANLAVAGSDAVKEVGLMPESSAVFVSTLRYLAPAPRISEWPELNAAVNPLVKSLFISEPTLDLDLITDEIDVASRTVLAPEAASGTPSPTPAK